jgi:hypothetical protein
MRFEPYDPAFVAAIRAGGPDAHGRPAERRISDGLGNPCRACLHEIEAAAPMLVLAACPFPEAQPYAEVGPIFLHAAPCDPWTGPGVPPILRTSSNYLVKGYTADHRIAYGTGTIVPAERIAEEVAARLASPEIAFVDVRSARYNCFQTRARRQLDK